MKRCAAPWHGLHINPRGDVKTCCASDPNMLGNLNTHSVNEMLNSSIMQEVRSMMKEGILHPKYCRNCLNGSSEIDWHNSINEGFDYENAPLEYLYPTIVDARWNITCNQSCNYCDANASSSWASITGSEYKASTRKYTLDVIDLIEKNKNLIQEVALVGGEPLLLKENSQVLDALKGSKCKVVVITNLNVDLENNEIFKKLAEHDNVGWSLSFDNIGEQYEYVRYGGSWELHEKNVNTVLSLINDPTNNHTGGIHAVYSLYNATCLYDFKKWANDRGLPILYQRLFSPKQLDVTYCGEKLVPLIVEQIDNVIRDFVLQDPEKTFLLNIKEEVLTQKPRNANFMYFLGKIENDYHPNTEGKFEKLWPEIYQALGPL
jgi:radical SAM protein with 4Fe4S-binding SPASM domain